MASGVCNNVLFTGVFWGVSNMQSAYFPDALATVCYGRGLPFVVSDYFHEASILPRENLSLFTEFFFKSTALRYAHARACI